MQEGSSQHSPRVDTRVIYDRETGEIIHIHQAVALPGSRLPDENELKVSAMDLAGRMTGKPVRQMDVLSVREEEVKTGTKYKVNVQNRRLIALKSD